MRTLISIICIFALTNLGLYSQNLSYNYPLSFPVFSEDIDTVKLYSKELHNFDLSNIDSDYEIESKPMQITILEEGRILKHLTPIENREVVYEYDDRGNIKAKEFNSPERSSKVEFKLCPEDLTLDAYAKATLKERVKFDKDLKVISRSTYGIEADGEYHYQIKTSYTQDKVAKREYFKNEILQRIDSIVYVHQLPYEADLNLDPKYTLTYTKEEPLRTESISFQGVKNKNRSIEFYDSKGNMIKKYYIVEKEDKTFAKLEEFRIN